MCLQAFASHLADNWESSSNVLVCFYREKPSVGWQISFFKKVDYLFPCQGACSCIKLRFMGAIFTLFFITAESSQGIQPWPGKKNVFRSGPASESWLQAWIVMPYGMSTVNWTLIFRVLRKEIFFPVLSFFSRNFITRVYSSKAICTFSVYEPNFASFSEAAL